MAIKSRASKSSGKSRVKHGGVKHKVKQNPDAQIILDEESGLTFYDESQMLEHFKKEIEAFEKEYLKVRSKSDFSDEESEKYFKHLDLLLDDPDEIWMDDQTFKGKTVWNYIREFEDGDDVIYYIAIVHLVNEQPTFIYLHFPTRLAKTADHYARGELRFDRIYAEVKDGAVEGDSLSEGDELAVGLYKSMIKLRSEADIPESQFGDYSELREESIEEADEIWRSQDIAGQTLVNFIKSFPDHETLQDLHYIVVTLEEDSSNSHALLFSFPTTDLALIERYRHGENLHAEEIVQEASH